MIKAGSGGLGSGNKENRIGLDYTFYPTPVLLAEIALPPLLLLQIGTSRSFDIQQSQQTREVVPEQTTVNISRF